MVVKGGIVLGVVVGVFMLLSGFSGMYKNPSLGFVFPLGATLIELGVLIWALRQTAADKAYWGQVGTGTLIAVTGGVVIIVFSLLFTTVLFTDYKDVALARAADGWRDAGLAEDRIQQQLKFAEGMMGPVPNALIGFVMTVLTGFVESLIVGAFARKKS